MSKSQVKEGMNAPMYQHWWPCHLTGHIIDILVYRKRLVCHPEFLYTAQDVDKSGIDDQNSLTTLLVLVTVPSRRGIKIPYQTSLTVHQKDS